MKSKNITDIIIDLEKNTIYYPTNFKQSKN